MVLSNLMIMMHILCIHVSDKIWIHGIECSNSSFKKEFFVIDCHNETQEVSTQEVSVVTDIMLSV